LTVDPVPTPSATSFPMKLRAAFAASCFLSAACIGLSVSRESTADNIDEQPVVKIRRELSGSMPMTPDHGPQNEICPQ
jgi:cytochrome c oxidase assembly factor CtaG